MIPATDHRRSILEPSRGVKGRKARNVLATVLIGICVRHRDGARSSW